MANLLRGIALFLLTFTVASGLAAAGTNLWWLDLRALAPAARAVFCALVALALLAAIIAPRARWLRLAAMTVLGGAALAAAANALVFYRLLGRGEISSSFPLPFSLVIAAALTGMAAGMLRPRPARVPVIAAGAVFAFIAFPLLQVAAFGATDYRRQADVILVFGARAYVNGAPSSPLADRVHKAVELYHAGYAPKLLFSGGPGDGAIHEPEAMRRLAMRLGVPGSAIVMDPHGLNTDATVRNTRAIAGDARVLAVSHFYHLPRIKLAFQRAGMDVYTVPCETSRLSLLPYNVPRESVAFWAYYLRLFTQPAVAWLLGAPAYAQAPVGEEVEVHVLEIEAVVLDRNGKTITGLGRGDFEVRIGGKPAEITNFYAVDRGRIVEARPIAGAAPDAPPQQMPTQLMVVIDDLHLHQRTRNRALTALKRYVETAMSDSTMVTVARWNGIMRTIMKPTNDRPTLLRLIGDIEREPAAMPRTDSERRQVIRKIDDVILHPIPNMQDAQASQALAAATSYTVARTREAEDTINALGDLITIMSGLEGRKVLLYVSEALPQQPGVEVLEYARQVFSRNPIAGFELDRESGGNALDVARVDQTRAFMDLASLAQSAGVVFSSLDPGGARMEEGSGPEYTAMLARLDGLFMRDNDSAGARLVATHSGGRYITNENDLEHAISVLTDDVSTYYSLGIRPPGGRALNLSVRVKGRDDLRVLTPRRKEIKSDEEAIASAVRARLYSRESANPLDVSLHIGVPWPRNNRCVAPVHLTVPPARLAPLSEPKVRVYAIVADERGRESSLRSSTHDVPGTIAFDFGFKPRRYVLSVAVVERGTNTSFASVLPRRVSSTRSMMSVFPSASRCQVSKVVPLNVEPSRLGSSRSMVIFRSPFPALASCSTVGTFLSPPGVRTDVSVCAVVPSSL
jgi:VWFA-related protein